MKRFFTEVFARIEVDGEDFPTDELEFNIRSKIRTKVMCHRENLKIIELGTKTFEAVVTEGEVEDMDVEVEDGSDI